MALRIIRFFAGAALFLLSIWGTLALYYSDFLTLPLNIVLAVVFALFSVSCCWIAFRKKRRAALLLWVVLFTALAAHWVMIRPTHDRVWRADMARLPYAVINGDNVSLFNYRNFQYRSLNDFTARYEARTVQVSHITSMDYFISYWWPGPVAHTFLSFNFDNAQPVCISIEARFEAHESFDPLASLFKQFELIYIVGSEQDIVGVRTNYRGEDVFMYRIEASPENIQRLFMVYLTRINQLAEKPEFYHLLSNNCSINIVRYANKIGRQGRLDPRLILNGFTDRYLYRAGHIDTSLPFPETRARAFINPLAQNDASFFDFSERIRMRDGASGARTSP